MRFLTSPSLERWRARLPYALFVFIAAFIGVVPVALILVIAESMGFRGDANVSLTTMWQILWLFPIGYAALFAISGLLGSVSGYQPFRKAWRGVPADEAAELSDRLRAQAEVQGFVTSWNGGHRGFVATRDMRLEKLRFLHSGRHFPMRLSVFIRRRRADRADIKLKLANRTTVIWDSGERAACENAGLNLLAAAIDASEPSAST